jgi:dTMP kinase
MFITLEGGEGTGKTTQAALLVARLRAAGYPARQTREPGGTPLGTAIRALLMHPDESLRALAEAGLAAPDGPVEKMLPITEVLLLSADRAQHVARLREWLADGDVVVCDRYADATRAYQGAARGLDTKAIAQAEALATGGLKPDLTLLFDLPAEEGQRRRQGARAAGGEWNRLDREALVFHEHVRQGYLALAKQEPERWVVLDATPPVEALFERVWSVVSERLPKRP